MKIPIDKTRLKIAVLEWHLGLSGANELITETRKIETIQVYIM